MLINVHALIVAHTAGKRSLRPGLGIPRPDCQVEERFMSPGADWRGLVPGFRAAKQAHSQARFEDLHEVASLHIRPAAQRGMAHAAAVEGELSAAREFSVQVEGLSSGAGAQERRQARLPNTVRRALRSPRQRRTSLVLGVGAARSHGPPARSFRMARLQNLWWRSVRPERR